MTQTLALLAPAKINLGLEILRRRPDGYHDLNTVFVALSLGDTVTLSQRDDHLITCEVEGAELPVDEGNLAVRAAHLLRARLGVSSGVHIAIEKIVPLGAGLGGGSSDAAAVLIGAPEIWGCPIPRTQLAELALELGSDVPFFLGGGVAAAGSRGEVLRPLWLDLRWSVLLVNPGIHVSTPAAFAAVGRTGERPATDLAWAIAAGLDDATTMREQLVNDFEEAVFAMHPEIAAIKRELYAAGAHFALMSGSGSTVFGLFESPEAAEAAAGRFEQYWTAVCDVLPPAP